MWKPPSGSFDATKPTHAAVAEPAYRTDPEKKRLYGLHLARGLKPFEAALQIVDDANQALWVSQNWLNDPLVIKAKNAIIEEKDLKLLDKEQLAAKFLAISEQKDLTGKFYIYEAKDRIAALKVYAEICGYIGKVEIDASTKNFTNNTMTIKLVSPDKKEEPAKIIEVIPNEKPLISLPKVKLVS